jgi:hypothetical protein
VRHEPNQGGQKVDVGIIDFGSTSFKSLEHSLVGAGKDTPLKETESGRGEVVFMVLLFASLILVLGWLMG